MPLTVALPLSGSLGRVFGLQEAGGFVFGVKSAAAAAAISRQGALTTPKIDATGTGRGRGTTKVIPHDKLSYETLAPNSLYDDFL